MKTETRTLEIPAYRCKDGLPTCRGCKLLWDVDGRFHSCRWSNVQLHLAGGNRVRPATDCPLWKGEK